MAVCNIFKKLTKETGSFLTFGQYMDDLTEWQTKSKYHRIVPSKFIAIDYKSNQYSNITLPRVFQEYYENACSCFKNQLAETGSAMQDDIDSMAIGWTPEYSKILFWNMMFDAGILSTDGEGISEVKYVGDINLQSYNNIDGLGYSEIYCHIPNEAPAYSYSLITTEYGNPLHIGRHYLDFLEGFHNTDSLGGWETLQLSTQPSNDDYETEYNYLVDKEYTFSWDDSKLNTMRLNDNSFNINMIVVLYDIWNEDRVLFKGIPMGVYITGLVDSNGVIQNSITKYVANEDIYNSGTSYGLRICSRYIVNPIEDNYVVKEVTCEDNNYGDLSRVLSQLSISQNKMDEVVNKTYNTEQNYKSLLAIFKNSKTNVPYIKIVNNESCWFVNGKLIGPSAADGIYDSYSNDEVNAMLDSSLNQTFQIIATAQDSNGKYIFEVGNIVDIVLKWEVYYEGKKVTPTYFEINGNDLSNTNQILMKELTKTTNFNLKARYGQLETSTVLTVHFVQPIYFGELPPTVDYNSINSVFIEEVKKLPKYISTTQEYSYNITTHSQNPGYICYAYPSNLGDLSYIKDMEGYIYYNYIYDNDNEKNDFMKLNFETLDNTNNNAHYLMYISKKPAYVDDQLFKFVKKITSL